MADPPRPRSIKQKLTVPLFIELVKSTRQATAFGQRLVNLKGERLRLGLEMVSDTSTCKNFQRTHATQEDMLAKHTQCLEENRSTLMQLQEEQASNWNAILQWQAASQAWNEHHAKRHDRLRSIERRFTQRTQDIRRHFLEMQDNLVVGDQGQRQARQQEITRNVQETIAQVDADRDSTIAELHSVLEESERTSLDVMNLGDRVAAEARRIHEEINNVAAHGNSIVTNYINRRSILRLRQETAASTIRAIEPCLERHVERQYAAIIQLAIFRQEKAC